MKTSTELLGETPYILVVDDEQMNRFVLEDLIADRYELELVETGEACLERVKTRTPELILLDINMPGLNGFEVCQLLKENPETEQIPVIFLTAKIGVEDERRGLQLGALDYITKPFTESILLARIETHLSLNRARRLLEQRNAILKKERDYIEYIMLSMRQDERFVTDRLSTLISPVEKSNGDLVLSALAANGHRYILLGDFTGHGLSAALAGPLVSSLFYFNAEQGVSLEKIAILLNSELVTKLPPEVFMAATLIDWDLGSNKCKLWNCGMPKVMHFRAGQCIKTVGSQGFALGVVSEFYPGASAEAIEVLPGDTLFGCTDGVVDVHSETGELFGEQRLISALGALLKSAEPLDVIHTQLSAFSQDSGLQDDATMIRIDL